jgi:membrane-associated protease RseP (regulator of RpoE activity)
MQSVVLVCDGDVSVAEQHIGQSVVVARGNITAPWGADNIVLMAGGKVTYENKGKVGEDGKSYQVIVEDKPNTLGITFFELSTVGVEVKVADSTLRVSAVAEGKPFAKAGIRAGDTITEVNGKKPDSAESLRRLLRDALALGDVTVTLRRGEKTETVKVSLPE